MATIKTIKRKGGSVAYQIGFYLHGKRRFLSLGSKYKRKEVDSIAFMIDNLVIAETTGRPLDRKTSAILDSIGVDLRERLENVGLVQIKRTLRLVDIFDAYWEAEYYSLKPCTQSSKRQSRRRFFEFFDENDDVENLTRRDAAAFVEHLERLVKEATRAGTIRDVRRVFNWAKENEMIEKNPFDGVARGSFKNKEREYYVSMSDYEKLLDSCPSQMWRVVIALYRIGGLRKEEALLLTWDDVDFARGRLHVHSPKTERYRGRESRVVPLFPQLRKELEALFDSLEEGYSPYIVSNNRATLTKHIERIVFHAGLNRWERLIQNLRSSRAIEVFEQFGEIAESEWIGHSPKTAKDHYLHVLDSTFERAISQ